MKALIEKFKVTFSKKQLEAAETAEHPNYWMYQ